MFPIITLSGAPTARGQQYGQAAAAAIRHSIASYARLFAYRRGLDWAASQQAALAYLPLLERAAPDLVAEMHGIARGSGRAFGEILALNVRTELLAGAPAQVRHPQSAAASARNVAAGVPQHQHDGGRRTEDGGRKAFTIQIYGLPSTVTQQIDTGECTTVAALPEATAAGVTLLAQNWDWSGEQRAACVLLRISAPGKPDILTLSEAGMLAKIGLNSAGVGVSLNILASQHDGQQPGMPVHVQLRLVLETSSLAEARAAVGHQRAGASSCITVAEAGGSAVAFELTPAAVGAIEAHNGLLVHTNHCLAGNTVPHACAIPPISSTLPRYDRATALLAAQRGQIDQAALMALLRDHDAAPDCICRHPDPALDPTDRVESVAGVVLDLAQRVMYLAPDVPCQAEFVAVGVKG